MQERKQKLLHHIIKEHIKTASPVGSGLISLKYMKDVSSPTVRNEMQELEREGFITHPHTSAGRIPTEQGYRDYIENLDVKDLSENHKKEIDDAYGRRDASHASAEGRIKSVAKKVADISENAAVVAFSKNDVYYTGLSNLFAKPEFSNQNVVVNMSQVIDHLDEVMASLSNVLDEDVSVLLGSDNPFGAECGSILSKSNNGIVFGILGPMRMDYEKNIGLVKYIKSIL
ncbi:MAG: hypothetical protein CO042_02335 [Parcubacteria group bacterium CG_4_9_14_0_2_um_filter_41_8]|nr:MAG: hypothetical protein AUJ34_02980 [Parcubacteria group bacterium CG1_02_41_12]PIZ81795.1 MAG: hypothetical protein COY02_01000 [Parcubacteria group bacterium CG_4_10_14_0_2_um_filter_41_6]PJC40707.1 MAG: hypothetical protein CO042_02335 [Parcubacteria group bacterium CG_4_9_14_0_2_um_filter_41_8]